MGNRSLNVISVISHDLGQQLGCYGAPDARTPNLDAFAAQGLRFANSFCAAPQCSSSRAAMWTGRYPHANGVVGLAHSGFANDLHPDERHLAQILAETGYQTHLFGIQHVSPSWERCGFQRLHGRGPCARVAADVEAFLETWDSDDGPLYMQVGLFEPHRPFPHEGVDPLPADSITVPPWLPDIPAVREDLADLEASAASADMAFGRIVEAIDRAELTESTVVVFTVDHGIAFPHAKMTLYDPGIETALLMRVPGIAGGRVHDEMIPDVDLMPALLDLLGPPVPANVQGRSFAGLIRGEDYVPNQAIHAEKTYHTYYDPMRAIRTERWKLIANFEFAPDSRGSSRNLPWRLTSAKAWSTR